MVLSNMDHQGADDSLARHANLVCAAAFCLCHCVHALCACIYIYNIYIYLYIIYIYISINQCEFIWLLIYNVVTGMVIYNLI